MRALILKAVTKFSKGEFHEINDEIAVETILSISVNNKLLSSILCSPILEKELVVGYLFTTGIILSYKEIQRIEIDGYIANITLDSEISLDSRLEQSQFINRVVTSGCNPPEYWNLYRN